MSNIWVLEDPRESPLLIFLVQLALTLALTRIFGKLFSYVKQPQVIGEIIAGVVLGPSVLGQIDGYTEAVWPTRLVLPNKGVYNSVRTFTIVANVGLILFMFLMGMELDRNLLKRKWKYSFPIALSAILFPFGIGIASALWLYDINLEGGAPGWGPSKTAFFLFSGASMSFTAFPVLAAILKSAKLLNSEVGLQAMSCAAIDDVLAWSTLAIASSFSKSGSPVNGFYTCLLALVYVAIMWFIIRPALEATHHWMEARDLHNNRYYFCLLFLLLIASAFTTELIGIHAFFGSFIMGLLMPKTNDFSEELFQRMELVVFEVFVPLYFASSGINTNIGSLNTGRYWGLTLAIVVTACFAKFIPACVTCKVVTGQSWRFSGVLGVLMNTRGMVEVIALNVGLNLGILSQRMFTMLILMALVTTALTSPLVWYFWVKNPPAEDAGLPQIVDASAWNDANQGTELSTSKGQADVAA